MVAVVILWVRGYKWARSVALARAVLVKDIQDDEVVGSNPAQVLRKRAIHEWQY